jgi:hypothetical protein
MPPSSDDEDLRLGRLLQESLARFAGLNSVYFLPHPRTTMFAQRGEKSFPTGWVKNSFRLRLQTIYELARAPWPVFSALSATRKSWGRSDPDKA